MTIAYIYDAFEEELHRYAVCLSRDADQADDLVQETFIRAMAYLELLNRLNAHQRRAWMHRVLKNLFLDAENRRRREKALTEQLTLDIQFANQPWVEPEPPDLFQLVPEHYRGLLQKRYVSGMNSKEIGQELGIPAATVRSRLHLAIKWLRANKSKFL